MCQLLNSFAVRLDKVKDTGLLCADVGGKRNYQTTPVTVVLARDQDKGLRSPVSVEDLIPDFQKLGSHSQFQYRVRNSGEGMDWTAYKDRPNREKWLAQPPLNTKNSFAALEKFEPNPNQKRGSGFCCDVGKINSEKETKSSEITGSHLSCPSVGRASEKIIVACRESKSAAATVGGSSEYEESGGFEPISAQKTVLYSLLLWSMANPHA